MIVQEFEYVREIATADGIVAVFYTDEPGEAGAAFTFTTDTGV